MIKLARLEHDATLKVDFAPYDSENAGYNEVDLTPLNFGRHKGKTPKQVLEKAPSYLLWLKDNDKGYARRISDKLYAEAKAAVAKPEGRTIGKHYRRGVESDVAPWEDDPRTSVNFMECDGHGGFSV